MRSGKLHFKREWNPLKANSPPNHLQRFHGSPDLQLVLPINVRSGFHLPVHTTYLHWFIQRWPTLTGHFTFPNIFLQTFAVVVTSQNSLWGIPRVFAHQSTDEGRGEWRTGWDWNLCHSTFFSVRRSQLPKQQANSWPPKQNTNDITHSCHSYHLSYSLAWLCRGYIQ